MCRKQCVLAFVICISCLAAAAVWVEAGKPPRPPQVPADPHIAFALPGFQVLVCNADGQRATSVYLSSTRPAVHPSLSPTRDGVVFSNPDGIIRVDFTVVNGDVVIDSSRFLEGPNGPVKGSETAWSPDGARIVFTARDEAGTAFIGVVPADGGTPFAAYVVPDPGLGVSDPEWNRFGDGIYFVESIGGVSGSNVVKALQLNDDGSANGEAVTIFSDPGYGDLGGVAAARTLDRLAFTSGGSVYTLDLDTGTVAYVCEANWGCPVWSPDDSQLMVAHAAPPRRATVKLYKVTLATGAMTALVEGRMPDWK